jgi:AcrR family transcriptional regulator
MPRPSRNVDQLLLAAGHKLLPQTGVRGLSIRQVAEQAGVNLGMFHYHFKTKDAFVRALLDERYEEMFSALSLQARGAKSGVENLRACLRVLAGFARDNRTMLVKIGADAFAGQPVAVEFLKANLPRHLAVILGLVVQAQKEGDIRQMPMPQALAFIGGAVGAPIVLGTAVANASFFPDAVVTQIEGAVVSDEAIAERIDMALRGLAPTENKPSARASKGVRK